jgi:hypothetical protein
MIVALEMILMEKIPKYPLTRMINVSFSDAAIKQLSGLLRYGYFIPYENLALAIFYTYVVFTVWPFSKGLPRAIRKPPKVYFYDTGDEGARAENLVACELKKLADFREDSEGYSVDLKYVRDKEGREVDFAWIEDGKLQELIEVKLSEGVVHKPLIYYAQKLNPNKATQIVFNLRRSYFKAGLHVLSPMERFAALLAPDKQSETERAK